MCAAKVQVVYMGYDSISFGCGEVGVFRVLLLLCAVIVISAFEKKHTWYGIYLWKSG